MPKKKQPAARQLLRQMANAPARKEWEKKKGAFVRCCQKIYPKAAQIVMRDWERMMAFYSFPQKHGVH